MIHRKRRGRRPILARTTRIKSLPFSFSFPNLESILNAKSKASSELSSRNSPSSIGWVTPLGGDIYAPGTTIPVKWLASAALSSPTLKLCASPASAVSAPAGFSSRDAFGSGLEDESVSTCGPGMKPPITESAGVYQAPFMISTVPTTGQYYILLEESVAGGAKMRSPVFTIDPIGAASPGPNSIQQSPPVAAANVPQAPVPAQAPFAPSQAFPAISSSPPPPQKSQYFFSETQPAPNLAAATQAIKSSVFPLSTANVLTTKAAPPPAAAFVVPLSTVGAVILLAGLFFFRRRASSEKPPQAARAQPSEHDNVKPHMCQPMTQVPRRSHGEEQRATWMPKQRRISRNVYPQNSPTPKPKSRHTGRESARPAARPSEPPGVTEMVLAEYMLPSGAASVSSSTSLPRCLLPAPEKLYVRDARSGGHPMGTPQYEERKQLGSTSVYAQIEHNLDKYRR